MTNTSGLRRFTALTLALIGCLLAVVSVVAVWSRNQLLDTDRYLTSVAPLASDPVIQQEVANKVADAINKQIDATGRAGSALPERLASKVGGTVDQFVQRQALTFTQSPAFASLWREINRVGHQDLVKLLTDQESSTVEIDNGRLILNLTSVAEAARSRLASAGLTVVTSLPPINVVIDVADAKDIQEARTAVTWLKRLSIVLPILSLVLLAASVAVRGRVNRPLVRPAVMLAASMVILWFLLRWGASLAADNVSSTVASTEAVHIYYDQLTSLLRRSTVTLGLIAAAVAAAAFGWNLIAGRRPAS